MRSADFPRSSRAPGLPPFPSLPPPLPASAVGPPAFLLPNSTARRARAGIQRGRGSGGVAGGGATHRSCARRRITQSQCSRCSRSRVSASAARQWLAPLFRTRQLGKQLLEGPEQRLEPLARLEVGPDGFPHLPEAPAAASGRAGASDRGASGQIARGRLGPRRTHLRWYLARSLSCSEVPGGVWLLIESSPVC